MSKSPIGDIQAKMQEALAEVSGQIEQLQSGANALAGDARADLEQRVAEFNARREEIEARMAEMAVTSTGALTDLRSGLEGAVESLRSGVDEAVGRFFR